MKHEFRDNAPTTEEIERRLQSTAVRVGRPMLWAGIGALKLVRRFGWRAQFEYNLDRLESPLVFAANHRSHVDTAAILGALPHKIKQRTAVAAALDVFGPDNSRGITRRLSKNCLQMLVAAGFHAFAFDRQGPPLRSIRTSVHLIRDNWNLLLFPEGTRSRTGEMGEFKAGVGVLARFTQRPVIPIFVEGGDDVLPYKGFLPGPGQIYVRFGAPMWYQDDDTPSEFSRRLQQAVRQLAHRQARADAKLAYLTARTHRVVSKQPA